ncbi:hypothetical protein A3715_31865 [Oleiphilus sp. HI0009]|nr:hypothetical protein A3715_31865 [Oleiphilus sp. HI0009]
MGRALQKNAGQDPQAILTMPLLEGLDGVQKMSKSLKNYVGVSDAPGLMYTKLLSMPDAMIGRYFELLSFRSMDEVTALLAEIEAGRNPQEVKDLFAREIIERFHGAAAAAEAHKGAGNQVALGEIPENLEDVEVAADDGQEELPISAVLRMAGLVKNGAAAKDVLKRGAVYVDGQKVEASLMIKVRGRFVIQAGKKKIARVSIK